MSSNDTIAEEMKRRIKRALREANRATQRGDFQAKAKYLSEAALCFRLLNDAGEEVTEKELFARCSETVDMFE